MENLRPCLVHTASFDGLLVGRFTRTSRRISKDSTQRHTFRHTSTAVTWSPGCVVRNQSENLRRNGRYSIWTQTLRTPTVFESEHLRLEEKTTGGMTVSTRCPNGRRAPVRESFGAKLGAACITAMISGPRYGSKSDLLSAADAIRSRARRQYTSRAALFLQGKKKMRTHPREAVAKFRTAPFRRGESFRSWVLYRAKHENALGVVRERRQVPPRSWRSGLRHHLSAKTSATIPSTRSPAPIK